MPGKINNPRVVFRVETPASMRPRHNAGEDLFGAIAGEDQLLVGAMLNCKKEWEDLFGAIAGEDGASTTLRDYTSLRTDVRGVARQHAGVRDAYRWTKGGSCLQRIPPQCQTAMRAVPGRRAAQDRSRGSGRSSYTITGPRSTTVKGLPRLPTRGRMPAADPSRGSPRGPAHGR
jgi:hypothetical protein